MTSLKVLYKPWRYIFTILSLQFLCTPCVKGMSNAYNQGASLLQQTPIPKPSNPQNVPGYAGTEVPQTKIRPHDLSGLATNATLEDEGAKVLTEAFEKRDKFVIDPHSDPLIMAGNKVVVDPQKALEDEMFEVETKKVSGSVLKVCEEGGDEYLQKCSKHLEIEVNVIPEVRTNVLGCPRNHGRGLGDKDGSISIEEWPCWANGQCTVMRVDVTPKKVEIIREEWVDGCKHLEALAEKGLCRYLNKNTSQKDETRFIEGEPFTRDHFEEYFEYGCLKAPVQSCAGLREKGCVQVKSECKEKKGGRCVLWKQTYRCPSGTIQGKSYRSSNKMNPFCLSGDCVDQSYIPNGDFFDVMSKMSVLRQAGDDLRNFGSIFKGQNWSCTRHCLNFSDCCGNGKGWGMSLKLKSCDEREKTLAELRAKNRCIQVGTYCAEKLLGVCIRKKTTFCCYDSKLAKIVQEQGKRQLGLGFGSPKNPQCQGLSIEQLAKLDFSKIDFSELFSDIAKSTKVPSIQGLAKDFQKSMKNKGTLLKIEEKVKKQPLQSIQNKQNNQISKNNEVQGRPHGQF